MVYAHGSGWKAHAVDITGETQLDSTEANAGRVQYRVAKVHALQARGWS